MSKIHLESLDEKRQEVFHTLSVFKKNGYLAGGTALALQINHRRSEDFDIFIDKAVDNRLRLKIENLFGHVQFYVDTSDQISFKTKEGVSITFVWYYYPAISSFVETESLSLASIKDIAADKAHTVGMRAVWRDYVDIFILLKEKIFTLERITELAKKKFKNEFIESQFLEQLRYFGDLKVVPIDFIKESYSDNEIKSFLSKAVEDYLKKILPFK